MCERVGCIDLLGCKEGVLEGEEKACFTLEKALCTESNTLSFSGCRVVVVVG